MEDLSPHDEDFAGWTDGIVAAKNITLNKVASELRHFGIQLIDENNAIFLGDHVPIEKARPVFKQDNPNNNPHYNKGWERGLIHGRMALIRSLRSIKAINDWDLIILDDGRPVLSSLCTDLYTSHEEQVRPTPQKISSESLHQALDSEEEKRAQYALEIAELENREQSYSNPTLNAPPQPVHQGQDAPAAPKRVGLLQTLGAFFMTIRKHMDRRTATFAIASAVLASGATFLSLGGSLTKAPKPSPPAISEDQAQGPQPVVPAIWANSLPSVQSNLMAIDSFIEMPPGNLDPVGVATAFLGAPHPQLKAFKLLVAKVICDRRRANLLPALIGSIDVSSTPSEKTRVALLVYMRKYVKLHGDGDFTPPLKNALSQIYGAPLAPLTQFQAGLKKLMQELGMPL